ncbi:magnesium/cobalt transporter CorA [Candidatus Woesearchaeota archaeon]|nr:magnesium/cobalt transporter CorA [Candidatus Woesearchaeota archaeon]
MVISTEKRSDTAGLSPGTLVYIGKKRSDRVKITVIDYDKSHVLRKELKDPKECFSFRDKPTTTWINIDGIHRVDIIETIGKHFRLHPLVLEDLLNTGQRSKMEDFDHYLFIMLKMLYIAPEHGEIKTEQVSIILGKNFVISFQEEEGFDVFNPIRERVKNPQGRHRRSGTDYLAYTLIDAIVDNYFAVLEHLGERIEMLEDELVAKPTQHTFHKVHELKRQLIHIRKAVWPLREVVNSLEHNDTNLIKEKTRVYLRDVYDHVVQAIDSIETFRETISGMLDIYLSSTNLRLQQIIKVLTIITVIFMPLNLIASIYGMNFEHMPELSWAYGYPMVIVSMAVLSLTMLAFFWKKRWIWEK